jgi:hypothetical protein
MDRKFYKGMIVEHFKRECASKEALDREPNLHRYKVIGVAMHTETLEDLMIYQAIYGERKIFARPVSMFLEKVDKEKYPDIKREYRLEAVDCFENKIPFLARMTGTWLAFYENDKKEKVWHGKVIPDQVPEKGIIKVKKKNGSIEYVTKNNFIGICENTKSEGERKILPSTLSDIMELCDKPCSCFEAIEIPN